MQPFFVATQSVIAGNWRSSSPLIPSYRSRDKVTRTVRLKVLVQSFPTLLADAPLRCMHINAFVPIWAQPRRISCGISGVVSDSISHNLFFPDLSYPEWVGNLEGTATKHVTSRRSVEQTKIRSCALSEQQFQKPNAL